MSNDDVRQAVESLARWDSEGGAGICGSQIADKFATSLKGTIQMMLGDGKPSWEQSDNIEVAALSEAGKLAKKHGISPDRAQMLIDRLGRDPKKLAAAAEGLKIKR